MKVFQSNIAKVSAMDTTSPDTDQPQPDVPASPSLRVALGTNLKSRIKDRIRHSLYNVAATESHEDNLETSELYDIHFQKRHQDELWRHPVRRYQIPLSLNNPEPNDCDTTAMCLYFEGVNTHQREVPRIVTGTRKGLLQVWNFNHVKCIASTRYEEPPEKERVLLALAPYVDPTNGRAYIIAGGGFIYLGFAYIWDVTENTQIALFSAASKRHRKPVSAISIVETNYRDSPLIVVASQDRTVSLWDFATRSHLLLLSKQHTDLLNCMAVHQTSNHHLHIITGSWDKSILFWSLTPAEINNETASQNLPNSPPISGKSSERRSSSGGGPPQWVSPTVPYYKVRGHRKSVTTMCIKEIVMGEYHFQHNHQHEHEELRHTATILVSGSLDTTVIVWDLDTRQPLRTLKGHKERVSAVAVYVNEDSPQFPKIVSMSDDCTTIIWDLATGQITRTINYQTKVFAGVAFQHNFGTMVVTGGPKGPMITNLGKTQRIKTLETSPVTAINVFTPPANAPDDPHKEPVVLIGTIDSTVSIYRLRDHKLLQTVKQHKSRINAVVIYEPKDPTHHPLVISCDGKAKIKVWDLYTTELKTEFQGHDGAVLSVALYDPAKVNPTNLAAVTAHHHPSHGATAARETKEPEDPPLDLTRPMVLAGGTDSTLTFWDLLTSQRKVSHPLKRIEKAHGHFVRSIVVHHPQRAGEIPYAITGSYDKTVAIREMKTGALLFKLENFHTNVVFFISLYDPFVHFGATRPKELPETFHTSAPVLVTSSWDLRLGIWSLDRDAAKHGKPLHSIKAHTDSITALTVTAPTAKEDHPLIVSGSIDRMVIVWDLFTGQKIQTLVGHTDRVCYITTYLANDEGRNPLILSGSDDQQTIIWEDSLHQKPFMPTRDDVNRCFDSDCLEDDWPLITELTKLHEAMLFLENPHLFFLAIKYNRPNFLLKFRQYLTAVLPLMREYSDKNLLTYAVEKNDLVSVRVILYCWTENLNRDIQDLLTQKLYHASYFFPDESLPLLAKIYPKEFENFIVCLRLVRNHYSLLMTEEEYKHAYVDYTHDKAVLFDDEDDEEEGEGGNNSNNLVAAATAVVNGVANSLVEAGKTIYAQADQMIDQMEDRVGDAIDYLENAVQTQERAPSVESSPIKGGAGGGGSDRVVSNCIDPSLMKKSTKPVRDKLSNPNTNTCSLCLHPTFRYETAGTIDRISGYDTLWKEKLSLGEGFLAILRSVWYRITSERVSPQPVTSLLVPLRNSAQLQKSIRLFVKIANHLDSVDIFDSEVGMVSLRFFWDAHAKSYHVAWTLFYLIFLLLFIASIYSYEFYYLVDDLVDDSEKVCMKILDGVLLAFFAYYIAEECYQIYSIHPQYFTLRPPPPPSPPSTSSSPGGGSGGAVIPQPPPKKGGGLMSWMQRSLAIQILLDLPKIIFVHFLTDAWNALDLAILITGIPGYALRFAYDNDIVTGRNFLALCSVCMWCKTLYFMRPFANSGPLVTMIINIAYNIRFFLLVLFCVLAGFTQALWLLGNLDNTGHWGSVHTAFLSSFYYMLGQNVAQDDINTVSPQLATFLMVMFMMIMIILMLNLLIALMGDAFAKVRSQGLAIWRKEQASIIIEESFLIPVKPKDIPPYIHVLKYASDVSSKDPKEYNRLLLELVLQSKKNVTAYTELEPEGEASSGGGGEADKK